MMLTERAVQINYDLRKPGRNYDALYQYLRSFNGYWPILESMWIVRTRKTPEQLVQDIKRRTDANDKVVAIDVTDDYWWTSGLPTEVLGWMHRHMGSVVGAA